jgi:hypothetical protein
MKGKLPPVEGLPKVRPVCPWCGKPASYWTTDHRRQVNGDVGTFGSGPIVRRTFARWNLYNGIFDRLVCALAFATASYKAGYRRTETP